MLTSVLVRHQIQITGLIMCLLQPKFLRQRLLIIFSIIRINRRRRAQTTTQKKIAQLQLHLIRKPIRNQTPRRKSASRLKQRPKTLPLPRKTWLQRRKRKKRGMQPQQKKPKPKTRALSSRPSPKLLKTQLRPNMISKPLKPRPQGLPEMLRKILRRKRKVQKPKSLKKKTKNSRKKSRLLRRLRKINENMVNDIIYYGYCI